MTPNRAVTLNLRICHGSFRASIDDWFSEWDDEKLACASSPGCKYARGLVYETDRLVQHRIVVSNGMGSACTGKGNILSYNTTYFYLFDICILYLRVTAGV